MKFKIGMPPDVDCDLDGAVRLVVNYPRLHGLALVFGACVVAPAAYVSWWLVFGSAGLLGMLDSPPSVFLGSLVLTVLVHELFHLVAMPGMGVSGKSVLGFDPRSLLPYAAYLGVVSKGRMLIILFSPILFLTAVPFFVALVHREWLWECSWLSILNATLASADIYMIFLVAFKVPSGYVFHGEFYGKLKSDVDRVDQVEGVAPNG